MLKVKARARHAFTLKQIYFNTLQHTCNLASLAISFVSEDTLETIKREQVEQKSVLKFSNKSCVRKSTTRFQCAQNHARRVIYKLNNQDVPANGNTFASVFLATESSILQCFQFTDSCFFRPVKNEIQYTFTSLDSSQHSVTRYLHINYD